MIVPQAVVSLLGEDTFMTEEPPSWRDVNRANWDERVTVHLDPAGYDLGTLRSGSGRFNPIEEADLPPVAGKRIAHLQCHFGVDTLKLLHRGAAEVIGLDFSPLAVEAARKLAAELNLADSARFVEADLYDALTAIPRPHDFDMVFVTWGALPWLPDIHGWARIVANLLRPGGCLYLAEGHPVAYVFDDEARASDGRPGLFVPYFQREPVIYTDPTDYANPHARLQNATSYSWMHPLGELITSLIDAGLAIERLREHDAITWPMFKVLAKGADGLHRWPDKPWLPLSFTLVAKRR